MERGTQQLGSAAHRFFIARVSRIYPAIFSTVLLFTFLFWSFGLAIPGITAQAYSVGSVLRNVLLFDTSIDGVMWSLQLEMIVVVMIFATVRFQRRWRFTARFHRRLDRRHNTIGVVGLALRRTTGNRPRAPFHLRAQDVQSRACTSGHRGLMIISDGARIN